MWGKRVFERYHNTQKYAHPPPWGATWVHHPWVNYGMFHKLHEEDTFEEEQWKSAKILAADTVCAKFGLRFIINFDKSHVL